MTSLPVTGRQGGSHPVEVAGASQAERSREGLLVAPPAGPSVLGSLRRFAWSSVAIVLLVVAVSGAVGTVTGGRSEATGIMSLTTPGSDNLLAPGVNSDAAVTRYASQRASFATSDAVLTAMIRRVPHLSLVQAREQVDVQADPGTNNLLVTVDAESPARSTTVANAVMAAYRSETAQQVSSLTDAALAAISASTTQVQSRLTGGPGSPEVQAAATTLSQLEQHASALQTDEAVFGDGVEFVKAASQVPGSALPLRELALGLVVGLGIAAVVAWLRADRDPRVEDGPAASWIAGAPLLGVVVGTPAPMDGKLRGLPSRAYRPVLPLLALRAASGVVLVTSPRRSEGRTTTALNLAIEAAREGSRVLVVDADLERATMTRVSGADDAQSGLGDLLLGPQQALGPVDARDVDLGQGRHLHVLAAGGAAGDDADVQLTRLRVLVDQWREEYDLVVVDAAPLPAGGLPALLARLADNVLLVVRRGSPASGVERVCALLDLYGAPIAGVLLTFGRSPGPGPEGHRLHTHRSGLAADLRRFGMEDLSSVR